MPSVVARMPVNLKDAGIASPLMRTFAGTHRRVRLYYKLHRNQGDYTLPDPGGTDPRRRDTAGPTTGVQLGPPREHPGSVTLFWILLHLPRQMILENCLNRGSNPGPYLQLVTTLPLPRTAPRSDFSHRYLTHIPPKPEFGAKISFP